MAKLKPIHISNFKGGWATSDPTTIEDNQLADARNVFYDKDEMLTMRRGVTKIGEPIPDATVLYHDCENTTNFAVSDDATNLVTGAAIRGSFSVNFDITVATTANDYAILSNSSLGTLDITSAKGYVGLWLYVPADFNTDLTSVKVQVGSDSSNYYEWTLGTLTEDSNNFIVLAYTDAATTGTPVDTSIDFFQLRVDYAATYTDKTGILIDSIYTYSDSHTKEIHSIDFYEFSNNNRYLLAGVGTGIFLYNEDTEYWERLNTTDRSDGVRWQTAIFKDIVYFVNGVNYLIGFDGTAITTHSGAPICSHIVVTADIGYMGNEVNDTSILWFTNANPADLSTWPNYEPINEDDGEDITGLSYVGANPIITKTDSTYIWDAANQVYQNADYDGGCRSGRCLTRVENDLYMLSRNGVFSLAQREGVSGEYRGTPLSNSIRESIDSIEDLTIAASYYWPASNNYYLSIADEGIGANRTILVFSTLTQGWTYYKGINANGFTEYKDEDDDYYLLYANAYGGQCYKMEDGFDDDGSVINMIIETKKYDFGANGQVVNFNRVDIGGFHSEQSSVTAQINVVNRRIAQKEKLLQYDKRADLGSSTTTATLGSKTLGSSPLAGSGSGSGTSMTMYEFFRYAAIMFMGRNIQVRFSTSQKDSSFALNKISIHPIGQPIDFVSSHLRI